MHLSCAVYSLPLRALATDKAHYNVTELHCSVWPQCLSSTESQFHRINKITAIVLANLSLSQCCKSATKKEFK